MKKLVILSDTHRNLNAISSIYDILKESDYIFHLGDHYDDMDFLFDEFKDKLTAFTAIAITVATRKR